MASFRKKGKGWVAEVARNGVRKSRSFFTKAEAIAWAGQAETELLGVKKGGIPKRPLSWLLEKYINEVSVKKKGKEWEARKLTAFAKSDLGKILLPSLNKSHFNDLKSQRLSEVKESSVAREWALLNHVFNTAVNEWEFLHKNPMKGIKPPKQGPHRDRRVSQSEIEEILLAAKYDTITPPVGSQQISAIAFIFAIETAMRQGEIVNLKWEDVDLVKRVATLNETKNGTRRMVPLSTEAVRIINLMPRNEEYIFPIRLRNLRYLFGQLVKRAGIENLHFHDSRHEAITRLARKLDVLDLARMVGHKDLKMLMIYYNATAEELALRLD